MENQWSNLVSIVRNDIVFDTHNKEYGAYKIRREYGRSLAIALILSIATISTLFVAPFIYNIFFSATKEIDLPIDPIIPINTLQQSLPDKVRIIPTPPAKKQVNTEKFTTPKIEDVIPENDTPPVQDLLQGKQITEISVNKGSEEIIINDYETKSIDDTEKIYTTISIQEPATFPGGDGALMRFLKENINYPSIEKENGIQGKVFLSFIIDKDGSVTNIELFKGLKDGPGCDREAIRVTKLVPKWNPGKHNGNLVKMRFILPISFKLQ